MRRLAPTAPGGKPITLDVDGETIEALEGEPVACALLAAGDRVFSRSVKYHRPRGPYCFAAACSHCLVRIDGVPNVYSCRTPARPGMRIEHQNAFPSVRFDVFAATDFVFSRGLDHHSMMAGVPVASQVMAKVARQLAGLGVLPEKPAPERLPAQTWKTDVAIVGAGAAGLAAAHALTGTGVPFLLFEREAFVGGRWALGAEQGEVPRAALPESALHLRSAAVGLFEDDDGRFLALVSGNPPRLLRVYADKFLLAMGGNPQLLPFENNDLPGIYAGRALSALVRRHRLLPGERTALVGHGPELDALARLLEENGGEVCAVVDAEGRARHPKAHQGAPARAHGGARVKALTFTTHDGQTHRVRCDAIGVVAPPSPSFELARQGGARVKFEAAQGLFIVEADADGRTAQPSLFVAGEVTGAMDAQAAASAGQRAAAALVSGGAR